MVFASIVAGAVLLVAAIRVLGDPITSGAATPATASEVAVVLPEATESPPVQVANPVPSAPETLRFVSRRIEPSYTVVSGDSLSAIAQRFNSTTDAIQSINNLTDRSRLSIGQRLIIP